MLKACFVLIEINTCWTMCLYSYVLWDHELNMRIVVSFIYVSIHRRGKTWMRPLIGEEKGEWSCSKESENMNDCIHRKGRRWMMLNHYLMSLVYNVLFKICRVSYTMSCMLILAYYSIIMLLFVMLPFMLYILVCVCVCVCVCVDLV